GGAPLHFAGQPDRAMVVADDTGQDGEAEPGAFARCLRREKRVEDPFLRGGVHPAAAIDYGESDAGPGFDFRDALGERVVPRTGFEADPQTPAPVPHLMPGV